MNFHGWAIYADGDMVCLEDIKKLWDLRDDKYAIQVVKHDYKTKIKNKYWGNKMKIILKENWLVDFVLLIKTIYLKFR